MFIFIVKTVIFFAMSKNGLALHVSKHVQCEGCKKLFNGSKKAEAIYLAHVKKCLGIDPKKKKQQTTSVVHHHYEEQISPKKIPSYVRTNIFECEKCPTVFKEKVVAKVRFLYLCICVCITNEEKQFHVTFVGLKDNLSVCKIKLKCPKGIIHFL